MLAARVMSSYDEFVHEPTHAAESRTGQSWSRASAPMRDTGRARSGVCGPTMWGSSVERSSSITWSKTRSGSAATSSSGRRCSITREARSA